MISHYVEKAYLFCRVAKNEMKEKSGIDFLKKFSSNADFNNYANNYFNLM